MEYRVEDLPDRIAEKISVQDNGCWHWTGTISDKGYGRFRRNRVTVIAHRYVYEHLVGPIPGESHMDHQCHNDDPVCPGNACLHRRCVNPTHLEPVTRKVNILRGKSPLAVAAKRELCDRCESSFSLDSLGRRYCDTCRAARRRVHQNDNRDHYRQYGTEYYRRNRERLAARKRELRAMKKNQETS